MKLLLSLYACEPNRGSEPGVGWNWAMGMAPRHEVYVLTRANNRAVIEAEIAKSKPAHVPTFLYFDLPQWMQKLKKKGLLPTSLYYFLWQFFAPRFFDKTGIRVDVIHHVTFNSFVCPGTWWNRREKVVLGPLGGMSICAGPYLRLFPLKQRVVEFLRGFLRGNMSFLYGAFFLSKANASAVLFTAAKMKERLGTNHPRSMVEMETAIPVTLESAKIEYEKEGRTQFLWAGQLEPWKGLMITLEAYQKAFGTAKNRPVLKILGKGSGEGEARAFVRENDLESSILFCGNVTQSCLWDEMRHSRGLVFSSVRDTSGNVALEAMAMGCPVICFNHQGVGVITDETCAIKVEPGTWKASVDAFAEGMKRLASDDTLVKRMGRAARARVLSEFTWKKKFDKVDALYKEIVESK